MKFVFLGLVLAILTASGSVSAQTKQRVHFAAGSTNATLTGTIRGYAYKDYVVRATAGQTFSASLSSQKSSPVMTVFLPNGDNLEGAAETDNYTGELRAGGDYVIRVLMMRAEARRPRSVSNYTLKISIH